MVLPSLEYGGMETFVLELSAALRRLGIDVRIVCIAGGGPLSEMARSYDVPAEVCAVPGLRSVISPAKLTDHFRRTRPDVVHTHTGAWNKGALAARLAGVGRVIHTVHGRHEAGRFVAGVLEAGADLLTNEVCAVSHPLAEEISPRLPRNGRRINVILNGVSAFNSLDRRHAREKLSIPLNASLVGTVGRLVPVKNHELLLNAVARMPVDRQPLICIIGDGPLRADLDRTATRLGIRDKTILVGQLANAREYLPAFDVFCLPSRSEGVSIALLEAMQCGVPIVATSVGGNAHVLGDTGSLVQSENVGQLANALTAALYNDEVRIAWSTSALCRVKEMFSLQSTVSAYARLYEAI